MDAPIFIETDRFEYRKVQPHFINPCCFGEDLAAWLKLELSRFADVQVSEPIQEDYGWGIWVIQGEDRFWVAVSYAGDGPQESPAQWAISVDPASRLLRTSAVTAIRDRIQHILASSIGVVIVRS